MVSTKNMGTSVFSGPGNQPTVHLSAASITSYAYAPFLLIHCHLVSTAPIFASCPDLTSTLRFITYWKYPILLYPSLSCPVLHSSDCFVLSSHIRSWSLPYRQLCTQRPRTCQPKPYIPTFSLVIRGRCKAGLCAHFLHTH